MIYLHQMNSTDIFRQPSFLKGMARVIDLFGNLDEYKYTENPDSELLQRDWENVGADLKEALEKHERKSHISLT